MTVPEPGVSLPQFTRADAVEAARLGLSRAEYELTKAGGGRPRARLGGLRRDVLRDPDPTSNRGRQAKPRPGDVIEISEAEYKELCLVAALARRFLPTIEQTSAPVTHHGEFEGLREALNRIALFGWATTGTEMAVGDLLNILDATRE